MKSGNFAIVWLSMVLLLGTGCGRIGGQASLSTEVAQESNLATTRATADSLAAAPLPVEAEFDLEDAPNADWSIRDRALAFRPELQAIQETYDDAIFSLHEGDLLAAQEQLEAAAFRCGELEADSTLLYSGLASLYLSSLRNRMDRLQEILDEESLMHFAAPLEVANDSLVALWYGGLPDAPSRPLEVADNERVQKWIDYFTGRGRKNFALWLDRGEAYRPFIESALAEYDLPAELFYLAMIESGFSAKAQSSAGAVGPWQFIRGTGKRYGLAIDYWVDERCDIVRSTEAACLYLSHLHGIFQDWNLAMAGYNSGEFRVQSSVRRAGSRNFWDLKLPRQTQDYVPKMMAATIIGRDPAAFDFEVTKPNAFAYEELPVEKPVDLSLIAKKGSFNLSELEYLNPHLLRWCTPPDRGAYAVHVPPGKAGMLQTSLAQLSRDESVSFAKHTVRKGETLYDLARGYGTTVRAIMQRNDISNARTLRAGKVILIPTHPDRSFREPLPNGVIAAAEKALPPLSVPSGQAKGFYTVRKGDNLSLIATKLDVRVKRLQNWNGLGQSTKIYPSQVLQYLYPSQGAVGQTAAAETAEQTKRVHVVRKGESLWSIARRYNTTTQSIQSWNENLRTESTIHPGDKLVLFVLE